MSETNSESSGERRLNQRFDIERTLRAVANGELRLGRITEVSAASAAIHLDQPRHRPQKPPGPKNPPLRCGKRGLGGGRPAAL